MIALPGLDAQVTGASLLDGTSVEYVATGLGTILKLPEDRRDPCDTVVRLTFSGKPRLKE